MPYKAIAPEDAPSCDRCNFMAALNLTWFSVTIRSCVRKMQLFNLQLVVLMALMQSRKYAASGDTLSKAHGVNNLGYCLTDLKLSQLLRLKKSLERIDERDNVMENKYLPVENVTHTEECAENCDKPSALALVNTERSAHAEWPEEKPSKLQTVFQISITALSFLSFGGYLLCLIVQAIKSKGTTYFHPIANATSTTLNRGVKRIKIYRRGRREASTDINPNQPGKHLKSRAFFYKQYYNPY